MKFGAVNRRRIKSKKKYDNIDRNGEEASAAATGVTTSESASAPLIVNNQSSSESTLDEIMNDADGSKDDVDADEPMSAASARSRELQMQFQTIVTETGNGTSAIEVSSSLGPQPKTGQPTNSNTGSKPRLVLGAIPHKGDQRPTGSIFSKKSKSPPATMSMPTSPSSNEIKSNNHVNEEGNLNSKNDEMTKDCSPGQKNTKKRNADGSINSNNDRNNMMMDVNTVGGGVYHVQNNNNAHCKTESKTLRSILNDQSQEDSTISEFFNSVWQKRCALFPRATGLEKDHAKTKKFIAPAWNLDRVQDAPLEELTQNGWNVLTDLLEQAKVIKYNSDNMTKVGDGTSTKSQEDKVVGEGSLSAKAGSHMVPLFFKGQSLVSSDMAAMFQEDLFMAYLDGCNIVLNHADWSSPWVAAICEDLQHSFPHAYANAYITPPGSQAVRAHADDRDVLVIQVTGCKKWKVYQRVPIPYPYPHQQVGKDDLEVPADVRNGPVLIETTLRPGDVLYMPRGYVHEAQGATLSSANSNNSGGLLSQQQQHHPSFHITIALATHDWTLAGLMSSAAEEIFCSGVDMRKAIPRSFGRDKFDEIDVNEKQNLQQLIDSAINTLKERVTANAVHHNLQLKYDNHNSRAAVGRRQIIQKATSEASAIPTNDNATVGLQAAKALTLSTVIRAATLDEKRYVQSMMDPTKRRGLQVREEVGDGIAHILTELKTNTGMHYRICDLRALLQSSPSSAAKDEEYICDLTLLCFAKQCVEQGALAIVHPNSRPPVPPEIPQY